MALTSFLYFQQPLRQIAVDSAYGQLGIAFDDGHSLVFIILDFLAAGNVSHDGQAVFIGKGLDRFILIVDVAAIENEPFT